MSRKKKTDGVQDALIPDEITPLMRERVVKADIERSLLDPWRDLPTSGGDVDPDTGEIKEG